MKKILSTFLASALLFLPQQLHSACDLQSTTVFIGNTYRFAQNILVQHDSNVDSAIVFKQADGTYKACINSSATSNEKGLYITIDGGTTKNLHVDDNGDTIASGSITSQSGSLILDANGNSITLNAPGSLAASYTLTLPTDDGQSGQMLVTDGSGALAWATPSNPDSRIEWGNIIGSNGNVANSSGSVSCTRNSTGVYTITITPGLNVTPVVVATAQGTSALTSGVQMLTSVTSSDANSTVFVVRVFTGALLPLAVDSNFGFIAIGVQ